MPAIYAPKAAATAPGSSVRVALNAMNGMLAREHGIRSALGSSSTRSPTCSPTRSICPIPVPGIAAAPIALIVLFPGVRRDGRSGTEADWSYAPARRAIRQEPPCLPVWRGDPVARPRHLPRGVAGRRAMGGSRSCRACRLQSQPQSTGGSLRRTGGPLSQRPADPGRCVCAAGAGHRCRGPTPVLPTAELH